MTYRDRRVALNRTGDTAGQKVLACDAYTAWHAGERQSALMQEARAVTRLKASSKPLPCAHPAAPLPVRNSVLFWEGSPRGRTGRAAGRLDLHSEEPSSTKCVHLVSSQLSCCVVSFMKKVHTAKGTFFLSFYFYNAWPFNLHHHSKFFHRKKWKKRRKKNETTNEYIGVKMTGLQIHQGFFFSPFVNNFMVSHAWVVACECKPLACSLEQTATF